MKLFLVGLLVFIGTAVYAADEPQPFGAVLAELITRNIFELGDDVAVIKDQAVIQTLVAEVNPVSVPDLNFTYHSGAITHFGNAHSDDVYLGKDLFCYRLFAPSLGKPKQLECAVGGSRLEKISPYAVSSRFSDMVMATHIQEMFLHLAKYNYSNVQTVLKTKSGSFADIRIEPSPWLRYTKRAGLMTFIGGMDQVQPLSVGRDARAILFCEAPGKKPCTMIKLN